MASEKKIPVKNYVVLSLIILFSISLVIYLYMWHRAYKKSDLNNSILIEYLNVIQYNELDNYLVENKDAIIYVSILNDNEINDFEKKFKKVITKYSINNSILYLDITNVKRINSNYMKDVPFIISYRDGNVKSIYDIKDNKYNIDSLIDYLKSEGVISD